MRSRSKLRARRSIRRTSIRVVYRRLTSCRFEAAESGVSALEKLSLVFTILKSQRRSKSDGAQKRHRQERSFWQNAIEVFEIDWNQFDIGSSPAEMVESALERHYIFAGATRSLWENNQRVMIAKAFSDSVDRVAR